MLTNNSDSLRILDLICKYSFCEVVKENIYSTAFLFEEK
jgi:hypothetical protein